MTIEQDINQLKELTKRIELEEPSLSIALNIIIGSYLLGPATLARLDRILGDFALKEMGRL